MKRFFLLFLFLSVGFGFSLFCAQERWVCDPAMRWRTIGKWQRRAGRNDPSAAQSILSICAIFRDEAPYFKEWIEFHKIQGAEHFYLYNNNSADNYLEVLLPYVDAGEVTLINWPFKYQPGDGDGWLAIQRSAYMHCISHYGRFTEWLAVLDIDEFLFSPSGQSLPLFLADYREFGGVCANWRQFGTSDVESIPPGQLMIELLTHCNFADHESNHTFKSIVRPDRVLTCKGVHSFLYKGDFYAVDTQKNRVDALRMSDQIDHDQLQINHYWTRTKMHFINRKVKSKNYRRFFDTEEHLSSIAAAYELDTDFSILQFVPFLKRRMFLIEAQ